MQGTTQLEQCVQRPARSQTEALYTDTALGRRRRSYELLKEQASRCPGGQSGDRN